ncbi:helix-turn-helix domain-containing protein [Yersinia ruckeri]|uniref:helix-turn-helix domain-containing protein n=1 Tax=Yersinia ruckeri TaxID=29486 RepID=UPI0022380576|nr:helix-turn-helix transcriptional regulator [Yersinia ruckeri]MCW6598885.1 helix-turn-helix domain-containing protein [Yersinia ruckeri]
MTPEEEQALNSIPLEGATLQEPSKVQFINDDQGNPLYAILPIAEYNDLLEATEVWESIPVKSSDNDDETIPHEVVDIMIDQTVSLAAAWRIYRNFSQLEVAEVLGVTQSTVSQWEASEKPNTKTREKLAEIYHCRPTQLY